MQQTTGCKENYVEYPNLSKRKVMDLSVKYVTDNTKPKH